ncbi:sugar nucleotide-binding protein [Paenibacillus sp. HJL G12]|uniref:dTDP-4-dehydrorhamnose reductase n=1 Tax=Paenibacillus dendrobii TaxID=2691084 RepID=A0A7X3IMS9_9BACL|nr:SDR family oxidoreductase [Paenibacillus dendrobii]MWV46844.1 sugar nucleotide-binding protein [Paenibacillus dendrobii]
MKLLILGGNGMAGHMLVDYFQRQGKHQVFYTTRDQRSPGGLFLDVSESCMVEKVLEIVRPDIVINAIGVLNQFAEEDRINAYHVNGFLPHRLRRAADVLGSRLIHISTDCVFEGTTGGYEEDDEPDGTSTYALTKALGEVRAPGHLTIRTSIIGPENRSHGIGLMHWFMSQKGAVSGYRNVLWNGVTTLELAKAIDELMCSSVSGLMHLAHPVPISKHDLLLLFQEIWKVHAVTVEPAEYPKQDRTLVSSRTDVHYNVPHYRDMLKELERWMNELPSANVSF